MSNLQVHHIGYLVKNIDAATKTFTQLGYSVTQNTVYDDIRKVNICFLEKDGYVVELVSPTDADSVVTGLLKKHKNMPYHICYESSALEEDLARLTTEGFTAIDSPTPAPALSGRRVVFLMSATLGMIELLESAN